ncbi:MAG: hypothetical protein IKZ49_01840 [Alphaproteobacteria bacterium]|nr:hypothetical protein [Alphaproteobacteria bacterium]
MNTKKQEKLYKDFEKENEILFPLHNETKEDVVREDFIKKLIQSPDFVKTIKDNNVYMADSVKEIIKKFGIASYIFIALTGFTLGGIATGISAQDEQTKKIDIKNIDSKELATIFLLFCLGIVLSSGTIISFKQVNQESAIDAIYHRASVRLFKELKKYNKDLNEDVLKSCNPEMARVIKTLLMANMPKEDVLKIRSIALRTFWGTNNQTRYNSIEELKNKNKDIKDALKIMEKVLLFDENLKKEVLNVYRGNIPATFMLNQLQQQNIK